ncbi:MAG: response regulator, partial [Gammaproteobacteria bacterium]|nr:response regulator [Gammaproteobacteria bacterium]
MLNSLLLLAPLGFAMHLYLDAGKEQIRTSEYKLEVLEWLHESEFFQLFRQLNQHRELERIRLLALENGRTSAITQPGLTEQLTSMIDRHLEQDHQMDDAMHQSLATRWKELLNADQTSQTSYRLHSLLIESLLQDMSQMVRPVLLTDPNLKANDLALILTDAIPELLQNISALQGVASHYAEQYPSLPKAAVAELNIRNEAVSSSFVRTRRLLDESGLLPEYSERLMPLLFDLVNALAALNDHITWELINRDVDNPIQVQPRTIFDTAQNAMERTQPILQQAIDLFRDHLRQRIEQQWREHNQARLQTLLALLPLFLLSYLLARRGASMLNRISEALAQLGKGHYDNQLSFDADSHNELQLVSKSVMELQKHLQEFRDRTKKANETSLKTIYELHFFKYALDEHAIVSMADATGNIIDVNDRFCEISGYTRRELIGQHHRIVKSNHHPPAFFKDLWDTIHAGQTWHGEIKNRSKDGTHYWVRATIAPFIGDSGPERYVSIRTDITELKQMQADLEEAMRSKDRFLATMSHELRTPLTSILGYSETLAGTALSSGQMEQLQNIQISGKSLLSLINDILDLSKIESGNFTVDHNPFNLQQLLRDVIAVFRVRASDDQVDLRLLTEEQHPTAAWQLISDSNRLRQVLINLVGNAVKFGKGKSVSLDVRYGELNNGQVEVHFRIEDTGIGMSPEVIKRLFRPFEQADNSISRRFGGTGLGLFISQQLVELMGGHIKVESEEGKGSCFSFSLPMECSQLPASTLTDPQSPQIVPSLQGRVLVADDTPEIRRLIESLVRSTGAEVVSAEDGQQAFDRAMGDSFDLILMDMQMPNMNGIEATSLLRQLGNETPIYALTANVMQSHRDQFHEAGCNGFLVKPIERKNLFDALAQHLQPGSGTPAALSDEDPMLEARPIFIEGLAEKIENLVNQLMAQDWE